MSKVKKSEQEKDKKTSGESVTEKKASKKVEPVTHIDRSNGQLLSEKDLVKNKPWIGPVSNQATVEKLTEEEFKHYNA